MDTHYGESCTGALCPLCDVPTEQMREALEGGSLEPEQREEQGQ
jgi:hypothetical protein